MYENLKFAKNLQTCGSSTIFQMFIQVIDSLPRSNCGVHVWKQSLPRMCENNNLILCPKVSICASLKAEIFKLDFYWRTQIHNDKYWKVTLSVNDSKIILLIKCSKIFTHVELI